MTAESSLAELHTLLTADQPDVTPYVLVGRDLTDPRLEAKRLQIYPSVANRFRELYRQISHGVQEDAALVGYVPGYRPPSHEHIFLKLSEHDGVRAVFESVLALLPGAADFTQDKEALRRMKFLCTQLGPSDRRAYFFRRLARSNELTRSKWMALWMRDGQYDLVRTPVLAFDDKVDLIVWDGYVYVLTWYVFEQLLGDTPEARAKVAEILTGLMARVPVANSDEFLEACQGQFQLRLKVLALEGREYLDNVTTGDVRRVAAEYGVPLTFQDGTDGEQVVFETRPQYRFNLLKILENACVRGALGNVPYVDASSKRPLTAGDADQTPGMST